MAMAQRTATTSWDGDLVHGGGTVNGASGALDALADPASELEAIAR